jgi:hypothetical protein
LFTNQRIELALFKKSKKGLYVGNKCGGLTKIEESGVKNIKFDL